MTSNRSNKDSRLHPSELNLQKFASFLNKLRGSNATKSTKAPSGSSTTATNSKDACTISSGSRVNVDHATLTRSSARASSTVTRSHSVQRAQSLARQLGGKFTAYLPSNGTTQSHDHSNPTQASAEMEISKECKDKSNGRLMGQFRAWTLDRRFLRNKSSSKSSSTTSNAVQNGPITIDLRCSNKNSASKCLTSNTLINACSPNTQQQKMAAIRSLSAHPTTSRNRSHALTNDARLISNNNTNNSTTFQALKSPQLLKQATHTGPTNSIPVGVLLPLDRQSLLQAHRLIDSDRADLVTPVVIQLTKDEQGELGIYVTGQKEPDGSMIYVVADFEPGGPAERYAF